MCKLFAILDIEDKKAANAFAAAAVPFITKSDNHGLGIMRLGENGIHTRRWATPPAVFKERNFSGPLAKYEAALFPRFIEAGVESDQLHALAIHGRMATCEKSLANTHPFFSLEDGTALMHNGVIWSPEKYTRKLSTCDSEALLWQYIEYGVKDTPTELCNALDGMGGYYACIVFNNNGVVDIWRDDKAELNMAFVQGVGTVICTTIEIIEKTAEAQKKKILDSEEIYPYTHIRWKLGQEPQVWDYEVTKPNSAYSVTPGKFHKETPVAADAVGGGIVDEEKEELDYWRKEIDEMERAEAQEALELERARAGKSKEGKFPSCQTQDPDDAYFPGGPGVNNGVPHYGAHTPRSGADTPLIPGDVALRFPGTGIIRPETIAALARMDASFKRFNDVLYGHKSKKPFVVPTSGGTGRRSIGFVADHIKKGAKP